MVTWSSTKGLKASSGKKIVFSTNGAGSIGGQHVEEYKVSVKQRTPSKGQNVNQQTGKESSPALNPTKG